MEPLLNRHFKVVFQPKNPELFGNRRRFCVGIYSLHKYVGEANAVTAVRLAIEGKEDKFTRVFRKWGKVEFYNK